MGILSDIVERIEIDIKDSSSIRATSMTCSR